MNGHNTVPEPKRPTGRYPITDNPLQFHCFLEIGVVASAESPDLLEIKAVQRALDHAALMTLDRDARLFMDDLETLVHRRAQRYEVALRRDRGGTVVRLAR